MAKTVLVTGGTGFIGSHTIVELCEKGYEVVVVDNLVNSSRESLARIESLVDRSLKFYELDIRDEDGLDKVFSNHAIDAVMHFAGLKAVGESTTEPLLYYDNNLLSSIVLCRVMAKHNVKQLVFSSSATIYGLQPTPKYNESMPMRPVNPYGQTKAMAEQILSDLANTHKDWRITSLRYFNPVGAHPSGLIGEDPNGVPNNLFPYVAQVAAGQRTELSVFGGDYDTPDGTGVRDYIHVVDLARGHVAALEHPAPINTYTAYNLGSGSGNSVLEVIKSFEAVSHQSIPYKVTDRRPGDLAIYYADPAKALRELGWKTTKSLSDACADTWRWQQNLVGQSRQD